MLEELLRIMIWADSIDATSAVHPAQEAFRTHVQHRHSRSID